jgi:hypothetical protein
MTKKNILPIILAAAGTILVWLPLLAPLLFSLVLLTRAHVFRLDYLMPAELFPLVLAGALALIAAALLARSRLKLIGLAFAFAVALPIGGQLIAEVTGLASGETEPGGWQWALVLASLAGYVLAVAAMGVGGVLLLRDLFRQPQGVP